MMLLRIVVGVLSSLRTTSRLDFGGEKYNNVHQCPTSFTSQIIAHVSCTPSHDSEY